MDAFRNPLSDTYLSSGYLAGTCRVPSSAAAWSVMTPSPMLLDADWTMDHAAIYVRAPTQDRLTCLDMVSGEVKWSHKGIDNRGLYGVTQGGDFVVLGCKVLDKESGDELFDIRNLAKVRTGQRQTCFPFNSGFIGPVAEDSGRLLFVDVRRSRASLPGVDWPGFLAQDGRHYVGGSGAECVAYDLREGRELWRRPDPDGDGAGAVRKMRIRLSGTSVYQLSEGGRVTKLGIDDGVPDWSRSVFDADDAGESVAAALTSAAVGAGHFVAGRYGVTANSGTWALGAFSAETLEPIWKVAGYPGAQFMMAGRMLLVRHGDGRLCGLDLADGTLLWEMPWPMEGLSGVKVAGQSLVVATTLGEFHCYRFEV